MINYQGIAWAIDFEGHIGIGRKINKNESMRYYIYVRITNTNKELLEDFNELTKLGKVNGPVIAKNKTWKNLYNLNMSKDKMREHLPKILPYLLSKDEQCKIALRALEIIKNRNYYYKLSSSQERNEPYTYDEICELDFLYRRCGELNKRGVQSD